MYFWAGSQSPLRCHDGNRHPAQKERMICMYKNLNNVRRRSWVREALSGSVHHLVALMVSRWSLMGVDSHGLIDAAIRKVVLEPGPATI